MICRSSAHRLAVKASFERRFQKDSGLPASPDPFRHQNSAIAQDLPVLPRGSLSLRVRSSLLVANPRISPMKASS
jgi:hypothetical protein